MFSLLISTAVMTRTISNSTTGHSSLEEPTKLRKCMENFVINTILPMDSVVAFVPPGIITDLSPDCDRPRLSHSIRKSSLHGLEPAMLPVVLSHLSSTMDTPPNISNFYMQPDCILVGPMSPIVSATSRKIYMLAVGRRPHRLESQRTSNYGS